MPLIIEPPNQIPASLIIELPNQIPPPKFRLFQRVEVMPNAQMDWTKECPLKLSPGVIVGMQFVTLFSAFANRSHVHGWEYQVDFHFDSLLENALKVHDTVQYYHESDLAVEVES